MSLWRSQEQVALMLQSMFRIEKMPENLDATDGLAAAVCHFYQKNPSKGNTANVTEKSWKAFIANHPARVK
ncbi:MAG: hypothetical protein LBS09_03710 [Bacteroidales bacterium]|nr:hypothetical protein [Bacteroidales bacterium]